MATAITSPAKPAPATFTRIASQRDVGSPNAAPITPPATSAPNKDQLRPEGSPRDNGETIAVAAETAGRGENSPRGTPAGLQAAC